MLKFNIYEKQFLNFIDQFLSKKLIIQKSEIKFCRRTFINQSELITYSVPL